MTVEGGVETTYEYDDNNRLITETKITGDITDITRYQYDNNSNQVYKATETIKPVTEGETESISGFVAGESADGTNVTFNQYNGFNQLIKTTVGDKTIDYTYNGDGLRTSKTVNDVTTTHIWDGGQIVLELDGAGNVTGKYVRGINLLYAEDGTGANRKWYLFNGHGDVVQLTGTDGNVTKTYDYDAFGNEKDPDPNDTNVFRYCGEYFDKETGTIYLRARYYDPVIGRFISEDSYLGKDNDPLSLNLYVYCGNNPVMLIDPSGHSGGDVWNGTKKFFVNQWETVKEAVTHPVETYKNYMKDPWNWFPAAKGLKRIYDFDVRVYNEVIMGDEKSRCEFLGEYVAETGETLLLIYVGGKITNKASALKGMNNSTKWVDEAGNIKWPANRGFAGEPVETTLKPGMRIDRYGYEGGTFVSPEGTPYANRALAPGTETKPYNVYEVVKPVKVQSGEIAPWFDQPGRGIQYEFSQSISDLLKAGIIKKVGP